MGDESSFISIEKNSAEIVKLIENKALKPVEIKPTGKAQIGEADWYFYQGHQSRLRGDFDAAIGLYRKGLKIDSGHLGIQVNLGVCLMRIGLLSRAVEQFSNVLCPQSLINSSICHIATQDYSSAIHLIEKAISLDPSPSYFQLLSLALFRAGRVTEALESFQDVGPSESLMQDERDLRFNKDPKSLFPFKVGEIDPDDKKRKSLSMTSTCFSGRSSLENSLARSGSRKRNYKKGKIAQKKSMEVEYPNKLRQVLPSYEEIIEKKIVFDRMVRMRHNTIVEAISTSCPSWKYDGFVQQKVENAPRFPYEDFIDSPEAIGKINKIKNDLNEPHWVNGVKYNSNQYNKLFSKRLNDQTLKIVSDEYQLDQENRDYKKLEKVLKNLHFFSKFPPDIRFKLLISAVFRTYEHDEVIIKQGEIGDSMFVILAGSILIKKTSQEFGNLEVIINSMYDGETFGELALLSEGVSDSIRRSATCVAGEKTVVLAISKRDYKRILLDEMENDITGKVSFFLSLPFFHGCSGISMIPLASNIEAASYKIDDVILELGEKPKGLYVIYKGRCSMYWEGYEAKPSAPSNFSNVKIRPKTANFLKNNRKKTANLKDIDFDKAKPYLPKKLEGLTVQKNRILCKPLQEGDFFGGRALIEGLLDTSSRFEQRSVGFEIISADPAKFSVVAESAEVKVFILTKKHFPLLSEEILEKLKIFLTKADELDCPKQWTEDFLKDCFVNWSRFKMDLVRKVELDNYMAKHRSDAPRINSVN